MCSSDVRYQWLAAICGKLFKEIYMKFYARTSISILSFKVNILEFGFGTVIGWPSASFLILESKDTPLASGPLTIEQISWVGSLVPFGGLCGNMIFGWLSGRYGRKYSLMAAAIPQLVYFEINIDHTFLIS